MVCLLCKGGSNTVRRIWGVGRYARHAARSAGPEASNKEMDDESLIYSLLSLRDEILRVTTFKRKYKSSDAVFREESRLPLAVINLDSLQHLLFAEKSKILFPYPAIYDDAPARKELALKPDYSMEDAVREHLETVARQYEK
jgi:hypothetical protein